MDISFGPSSIHGPRHDTQRNPIDPIPTAPNPTPSPLTSNPLRHLPLSLSAGGRPFLESSPTLPPSPTASRQPCLGRGLRSLAAATPSSRSPRPRRRPPPRASPTSARPDAFRLHLTFLPLFSYSSLWTSVQRSRNSDCVPTSVSVLPARRNSRNSVAQLAIIIKVPKIRNKKRESKTS
jgi:hypothetical protein